MQPPEISLRGAIEMPSRLAMNPNVLFSDEAKVMGFYLMVAFLKLLGMLTSMSIFLVYTRLVLFEKIFASTPYITERPKGTRISSEYPAWDHAAFWVTVGHTMIYNLRSLDYEFLSMSDFYQAVVLYIATDLCFWVSHGIMHTKSFFYPSFHKMHHSVHKPTSYEHCEKFTYIDGISHMVCFWTAYRILFCMAPYNPIFLANGTGLISNRLWLLACVQWYQVGQWQHGGKNIPSNQVPGLQIVMNMCGVKHRMCLLHDLHHTKFNYNFGMTGIWDKLFGTNYKTEPTNAKPKAA
jgi:sterol desaturase/sphingolipid hydroxylase (fatty acid hydroxylase superfamily)